MKKNAEQKDKLAVIVNESGLDSTKSRILLENFRGYFDMAADWEKKAKTIVVTDESQTFEMQTARAGRLFLREKRLAIEHTRKKLKESALREGKAIDGIANVLKALIVPIEDYLEEQEKFIEIKRYREAELARIEAERKAQEERWKKEEAERIEAERIRAENEKLRKEKAAQDEKLRKEREKAAAAQKRAQIARDKLAAERKAQEEERAAAEKKFEEQKREAERLIKEREEKERKRREELKKKIEQEKKDLEKKFAAVREVTCPYCDKTFNVDMSET